MRQFMIWGVLVVGCAPPPARSTFTRLDDAYVALPSQDPVEIYIDEPPPRRFRVVGMIRIGYVADPGQEPILVAQKAREYGCDLVTTQLVGAVAEADAAPRFLRASWSSGSSGSSGGGSSGGGWSSGGGGGGGGGDGSVTPYAQRPSYYCGIYLESDPATSA